MVLLSNMAWSVPQKRAPVCTTLGQPLTYQPYIPSSYNLEGAPLNDLTGNENAGQIMPKFIFQQYVDYNSNVIPV